MAHQLLNPLHVLLDMCAHTPASLQGIYKPQLPPEPLVQGAGLLPFAFLPWRAGRPAPTSPPQPMGTLVAKLLLPTLSSLVFLPTVSIAAKRQFHMEAMVYLFTMFFVAVSPGPWG